MFKFINRCVIGHSLRKHEKYFFCSKTEASLKYLKKYIIAQCFLP